MKRFSILTVVLGIATILLRHHIATPDVTPAKPMTVLRTIEHVASPTAPRLTPFVRQPALPPVTQAPAVPAADSFETESDVNSSEAVPTLVTKTKGEVVDVELFKESVMFAFEEVQPMLQACYEVAHPNVSTESISLKAQMVFSSDPEIGITTVEVSTISKTKVIDDPEDAMTAALGSCVKASLETMELPALPKKLELSVPYWMELSSDMDMDTDTDTEA